MAKRTSTKGRACAGKQRHHTREGAQTHLDRLVALGARAGRLEVYECRHCDGGWHVGHGPRGRR